MRVAFVGVQTTELLTFRREMLRAMAAAGHEVLAITPEPDPRVAAELRSMGVAVATVRMHRAGMNPLRDSIALMSLARIFRRFRPGAVLLTAVKPIVYGSLAARLAGVPCRAAMITGIGSVFASGAGGRRTALRVMVRWLYRLGLAQDQVVFFQNDDDQLLFERLRLVGSGQRRVRIAGSGIDLEEFPSTPLPPPPVTFIMVSRLLRDKGIREYVAAARMIRRKHPEVRIQLLGPRDPNPEGISQSELDAIRREGTVEYLGETLDVRPYLAAAHVCVLPSYREGTPRSVLEAMAMARPIITTDTPGCRETVDDGVSGRLVPARDAHALAEAMLALAAEPNERLEQMGRAARGLAESRYDVRLVNQTILQAMGLAGAERSIVEGGQRQAG